MDFITVFQICRYLSGVNWKAIKKGSGDIARRLKIMELKKSAAHLTPKPAPAAPANAAPTIAAPPAPANAAPTTAAPASAAPAAAGADDDDF